MSLLTNREAIRAKVESVYRTDPTPGAGDGIKVEEISFNPGENLAIIEPMPVQANLVKDPHTVASQMYGIEFSCELKGSGAAGTAPEIGPLLQACGMSETVVPATSVTYKPASTSHASVTIYYYLDGVLMKMVGARGTVSFSMSANERMMANFTFTGHRDGNPSDVSLVNDTWDSTVAQPFQSASFTIDSYAATINSVDFELGNNLIVPPDANQSNGRGEVQIVSPRNITGSFDPEHELVATEAFIANWLNSTSMALNVGPVGSAGNQVTITMPVVRYREASFDDRDGVRALGMGFQAYDSSGDDAVSIVFT